MYQCDCTHSLCWKLFKACDDAQMSFILIDLVFVMWNICMKNQSFCYLFFVDLFCSVPVYNNIAPIRQRSNLDFEYVKLFIFQLFQYVKTVCL